MRPASISWDYPGAVTGISTNSTAGMQIVNISQAQLQAQPSTQATVNGNLDPSAAIIAGPPGPASYSSKSSIVAYDNIGRPVTLDVYMSRTATAAGVDTWQVQVYDSSGRYADGRWPRHLHIRHDGGRQGCDGAGRQRRSR